MKTTQLYLLIPDQLPCQNKISETTKASILPSLNLALQALDLDCPVQAIEKINLALAILKPSNILFDNYDVKKQKKYQQMLDYDDYFHVKHVKSNEPEICLFKSILIAFNRFLLLESQGDISNVENIKIQREGFRTYFLLLTRVYNLYGDNTHE